LRQLDRSAPSSLDQKRRRFFEERSLSRIIHLDSHPYGSLSADAATVRCVGGDYRIRFRIDSHGTVVARLSSCRLVIEEYPR
jgi:hypothetical protein